MILLRERCLCILETSRFTRPLTISFATTTPESFRCSAICEVFDPGLAHKSRIYSLGFGSRASTGNIDTASCRVNLPVSCKADKADFTSPSALPRGNGIVQAEPTPLNHSIGLQSNDFNQSSSHSWSPDKGFTRTVSGSLSYACANQESEFFRQQLTAFNNRLARAALSQSTSSRTRPRQSSSTSSDWLWESHYPQ